MADPDAPLDPRILAKVPTLEGRDASEFRSYAFVLRASLGMANAQFNSDLDICQHTQEPIDFARVNETHRHRCNQLYYALALTTRDGAQVIVQQVEAGNGYEAWRRLTETYDPTSAMRGLNMLEGSSVRSSRQRTTCNNYRIGGSE